MQRVDVEIRTGAAGLGAEWRDLVGRAPPNVFMDPAATEAANETILARTRTLLAWDRSGEAPKLVGLWTLAEKTIGPVGPEYLAALHHRFALVANPVIDAGRMDDVAGAFLDAIVGHPDLPKVIRLKHLDGDCPSSHALMRASGARPRRVFSDRLRAFATPEAGAKRSGSTRKKLRQMANRLRALGTVEVINRRAADDARADFETFLAMEERSWKGARGSAFLSHAGAARYARAMFAGLAADGNASVALLCLDGTPIACQVLLTSGTTAYTWKTAFDAAYERYSPGAILVDRLTETLLDEGFTAIESCSPEPGFMTAIWPGRRRTLDLAIDLSGRRSLTFRLVVFGVRAYAEAKALRDRLRPLLDRPGRTPPGAPEPVPAPAPSSKASAEETA